MYGWLTGYRVQSFHLFAYIFEVLTRRGLRLDIFLVNCFPLDSTRTMQDPQSIDGLQEEICPHAPLLPFEMRLASAFVRRCDVM